MGKQQHAHNRAVTTRSYNEKRKWIITNRADTSFFIKYFVGAHAHRTHVINAKWYCEEGRLLRKSSAPNSTSGCERWQQIYHKAFDNGVIYANPKPTTASDGNVDESSDLVNFIVDKACVCCSCCFIICGRFFHILFADFPVQAFPAAKQVRWLFGHTELALRQTVNTADSSAKQCNENSQSIICYGTD